MARIGNNPEIFDVKQCLEQMKQDGLVKEWEIPYENLLTRCSSAIFFLTPSKVEDLTEICSKLSKFENFRYRGNKEKELSQLEFRIEFNEGNN